MKHRIGVVLLVLAHVVLLYTALAAPAYARGHSHLDPVLLATYASPWPVALATVVALTGIVLTLIPIRRGERWAVLLSLTMFLTLLATRLRTDPRCLAVLDPHQHGCHTFMISVALGLIGLALSASRPAHSH